MSVLRRDEVYRQGVCKGSLIMKPTGFLTNSRKLVDALSNTCSSIGGECSRPAGGRHRASNGRHAAGAQMYPSETNSEKMRC